MKSDTYRNGVFSADAKNGHEHYSVLLTEPVFARRAKRRTKFMLAPLVDVIFLLLIFFMLSSSVSPFSMLRVDVQSRNNASEAARTNVATVDKAAFIWIVSRGHIAAGSVSIALDSLDELLSQSDQSKRQRVVLVMSLSATVQDMVLALESFKNAGFEKVSIVDKFG